MAFFSFFMLLYLQLKDLCLIFPVASTNRHHCLFNFISLTAPLHSIFPPVLWAIIILFSSLLTIIVFVRNHHDSRGFYLANALFVGSLKLTLLWCDDKRKEKTVEQDQQRRFNLAYTYRFILIPYRSLYHFQPDFFVC